MAITHKHVINPICKCFSCGIEEEIRDAKYKCLCGGWVIPVSASMVETAQLLHNKGFDLSTAFSYTGFYDAI